MIDLALLQSVSYIVGALGVCVAAVYYVMTLRVQQTNMKNTLETRQSQLCVQIYDHFNDRQLMKALNHVLTDMSYRDYDDFMEKYGSEKNPDYFINFDLVAWNFDMVGALVSRNQIDPELVAELIGGGFLVYWEKARPIYTEMRRRYKVGYENLDYLYDKIRKIYYMKYPERLVPQ